MADDKEGFFDDEAEESEAEEEEEGGKGRRGGLLSSEDSEEEEDDDDGQDLEDLIDDNVVEEEEGEGDEGRERKKRRKRSIDDQLDDEDYDVILENTGISVHKKFKRVQMFDSDDEEEGVVNDEGVEPGPSDNEEELALDQSFDSNQSRQKGASRVEEEDDDEFGDFIVGDDGRPVGYKKTDLFSEPALLEAQEIFGVDFKPSDFGLGSDEEGEEEEVGEEEEREDDDDEMDGEVGVRVKKRKKKSKNRSIYDVYEPSELERSHLTDQDKIIRITDVPERYQTRAIPVRSSDEGELQLESDWVYHQAFCSPPVSNQPYSQHTQQQRAGAVSNAKSPSAIPKIKEALNFMRNYFFEVPFIGTYRREYVEPELNMEDLWKIYYWDEKWMQLQQRKKDLKKLFKRIQDWQFNKVKEEPERALNEDYRTLDTDDILRLDAVQTEEELSDVYAHFMLYYGRDLIAMKNKRESTADTDNDDVLKTTVKQSKKKDYYSLCQEAGLGALASKFGLTPEQFGENLRDNYQRHETEQHPYEPEEAAQEFIQTSGLFVNVRAVLQGACHMVAMQLASEPLVRQALRQVYQTRAVINVSPTKKGRKEIDESHSIFSYKYIKNKPVREIKGDEFLRLHQAETDGLINVKISIDIEQSSYDKRGQSSTFLEEIRILFYRDEFSLLVEKWNAQRAQSVAQCLMKVLYPQMEKELRAKLLAEAKEHVLQCCVLKFRNWLDVGNSLTSRDEDEVINESETSHRVMAVAYSDDWSVPSFACFLNGNGEVLDYLRLAYIHKRVNVNSEVEKEQKEEETRKLRQTMEKRKPDVVVVAASSRQALSVIDELKTCLVEADGVAPPTIELMDPNISEIYSKSNRAKEEFPSYPQLLLCAISLGRRVQEPLYEFTSLLSSHDEEYLSLILHPLQRSLSVEDLKKGLEVELVNKVNSIGVDINFCIEHSHAEHMLPYVAGFGPRKSTGLLKLLRQENIQLQNRSQIVTQCSIGPQVFINCAGFIKVLPSTFTVSDSAYVEVLDSTRVHPETYEWARKMAFDALEYYDEVGDESNPSAAVEDVMDTPEKLKDLDLDAFADELRRQEYGDKGLTLYDIRDELFAPFRDNRQMFGKMSADERFTLLTGETHDTIHEGKLITCTVVGIARRRPNQEALTQANPIRDQTGYWQCPFCLASDFADVSRVWSHVDSHECPGQPVGVRTRLENGLNGFIAIKNISDSLVHNPEDRVKPGMTIHCRILSVNIEKFSVDLTCRSSDLIDKAGKFSITRDIYFDYEAAEADSKKDRAATQQKPKDRYLKRVIVHPSFKNVSFLEAQKLLMNMEQGEAIFRPSSQGVDQLTLTWKVTDSIIQHVNIKEEGKPNQFSIGKSLLIGNEEYEDLDEILARYVQPLAGNVRDILTYKYYNEANGGDKRILEKLLKDEKTKHPKKIPYFLSASREHPGKFILSYQPSTRAKFEYVGIKPEGYWYRGQLFRSVNSLINWFKENFRAAPVIRHTPTPSVSSATPSFRGIPSSVRGATPYTPGQWDKTPVM
ncbi:PREDICTED: transcription elongation factor SPT6-like [Amphimedon queenslandica]|uniref:Uncharacterized protein n=1 Tax=Amphimedon queenslandica TaxID=400682 RepID=A0A1X7VIA2_AMPQE|nr:PREDICTED: transcription elongation factor SPT6-like [Amphimedon queenslandica]|eukprot:XP_019848744.1 PREDICTED: transcription elongation factor SPT6-like [Amphimedon queenslandica]